MPNKVTAIACTLLFYCTTLAGQADKQLTLPCNLTNPDYEYSGLGLWGSKVLLLPQYPTKYIYGIDTTDIKSYLSGVKGQKTLPYHTWMIKNVPAIISQIQGYQGFEAVTIVGNQVFFTIETEDSNRDCYLVKGEISKDTITLNASILMPLTKFRKIKGRQFLKIKEAGYECLTYIKEQNKLLVLFEYNKFLPVSHGVLIDLDLRSKETVPLQAIDFRLTDIYSGPGNQLYSINHYFHKEFGEYEPDEKIEKQQGVQADWKKDSYTRIIKLDFKEGKIGWTPVRNISFTDDNWEGIIALQGGLIMITDKYPGSKLMYFRLR